MVKTDLFQTFNDRLRLNSHGVLCRGIQLLAAPLELKNKKNLPKQGYENFLRSSNSIFLIPIACPKKP